jgi:hypothetical protein
MFSMTGQYEHPLHTFPRSSCQRGGRGRTVLQNCTHHTR